LIAGLVLAAGEGSRFGGPKAPVIVGDERLVDRAIRVLREGGCDPVLVVLGAWRGEVAAEIVVNEQWRSGMGSSVQAGLAALEGRAGVDAVVITLVDLPGITGAAVERLARGASAASLAAAAFAGIRGNPVLIGREHWAGVSESAIGDRGARAYLNEHDSVLIEVGDVADGNDIDHRADLPSQ